MAAYEFVWYLGLALVAGDGGSVKKLSGYRRSRVTDRDEEAPEAAYRPTEAEAVFAGWRTREARRAGRGYGFIG
jgi:hypothetical protein